MYNFPVRNREDKMNYLYNLNHKVNRLTEAYEGNQPIKNKVEDKLTKVGSGQEISIPAWIKETATTWGYDIYTNTFKEEIEALYSTLAFSNALKGTKTKLISDKSTSNEGSEFDTMLISEAVHTKVTIDILDRNYKYFLLGWNYVIKKFSKHLKNIHLKILYMNLINNSNSFEYYKLKNIHPDSDLVKNSQECTKLVEGYYSKDNENGLDIILNLTEEYMMLYEPPKEFSGMGRNDFYEFIKIILNELAGIGIFKEKIYMGTADVQSEIERVSEIIPESKLDEDFIRGCPSLKDWLNLNPNALSKPYDISTVDIGNIEDFKVKAASTKDKLLDIDPMKYLPTLYFSVVCEDYNKHITGKIYRDIVSKIERDTSIESSIKDKIKRMEIELNILTRFNDIKAINIDNETLQEAKELANSIDPVDSLTKSYIDESLAIQRTKTIFAIRDFIFKYDINTEKLAWTAKDLLNLKEKKIYDQMFVSEFGFPEILLLNNSSGTSSREPYIVTEDYMIISKRMIQVPKLEMMDNRPIITTASNGIKARL